MKECKVITYLDFKDNCEEAVNAYIEAFGGQILYISRKTGENCGDPSQIGKVMHVEFQIGETRLSGGDGYDVQPPRGMKLMIHTDTKAEALHAIGVLEKGGEILDALSPHPAPDDDGMGCVLRDRFGMLWIITCPNPDKQ